MAGKARKTKAEQQEQPITSQKIANVAFTDRKPYPGAYAIRISQIIEMYAQLYGVPVTQSDVIRKAIDMLHISVSGELAQKEERIRAARTGKTKSE